MAHGAAPSSRMGAGLSPYKTAVTLDVLTDYVDFLAYNIWIPGTAMHDLSGYATTTSTPTGYVATRVFPRDINNKVGISIRKPRHWINGMVAARVWWTGERQAITPDAVLRAFVFPFAEGDDLTSSTFAPTASVIDLSMPTNYTLGVIRDFDVTLATPVTNSTNYLFAHFDRNGASGNDLYQKDFHLIGLEVFYTESKSESSYKLRNDYKSVSMP